MRLPNTARVKGFDYRSNEKMHLSVKDWKSLVRELERKYPSVFTTSGAPSETWVWFRGTDGKRELALEIYEAPSNLGIQIDDLLG